MVFGTNQMHDGQVVPDLYCKPSLLFKYKNMFLKEIEICNLKKKIFKKIKWNLRILLFSFQSEK